MGLPSAIGEGSGGHGGLAPSPSPRIHFIRFQDGGVLFAEGSRRLWALNASAAYIWCALRHGTALETLACAYAERHGVALPRARRDLDAVIEQLSRDGLVGDTPSPDPDPPGILPATTAATPVARQAGPWPLRLRLAFADHAIELRTADHALGTALAALLAPFHTTADADPVAVVTAARSDIAPDRYDLFVDGARHNAAVAPEAVLPLLFALLFTRAAVTHRHHLLFHAAALGRGTGAILFPGESGAGKTTLTAALAAAGWAFFTDELAAIDGDAVAPLPFPMSVKPGSLHVLRGRYPDLAAAPAHTRTDGKQVRYLLPAPACCADRPLPVRAVVFPSYRPGARTRLVPLEAALALSRLAAAGSCDRPFTRQDAEAMVALVEHCACWELHVGRLDAAVAALDRQFPLEQTVTPAPAKARQQRQRRP